jgi:hypothetical protein
VGERELTVCVTGAGEGVDSVWEQKKIEARKYLKSCTVLGVQCTLCLVHLSYAENIPQVT